MAERIYDADFAEKALQSDKLVLIDFYSDSCVPCKMLSPVLAGLEEDYPDGLYIGKVNIAYESRLTEEYGILSAPTLIFFRNGKEIKRLSGVQKKAVLEAFIKENIR